MRFVFTSVQMFNFMADVFDLIGFYLYNAALGEESMFTPPLP